MTHAASTPPFWKANWARTQERFLRWWDRRGVIVGMWGAPDAGRPLHADLPRPADPADLTARWTDPGYRAALETWRLSRSFFPADVLPMAMTDLGPGSLALQAGARPEFAPATVWYHAATGPDDPPEALPPPRFDEHDPWWRTTEAILRACVAEAQGRHLVGCPDLIENLDILAALRGPETLLVDLLESPAWVERTLWEILDLWRETYSRVHDILRLPDGSSCFGAFYLWGPGRTAKVQCDASAMISPEMFRRFVVPPLRAQCAWLDHSLYHLDGTQALCHLDALLEIEELDAIEWTPQAGLERGADPRWWDLYRRILAAGKSVQIVDVQPHEIEPLAEALGGEGLYLFTTFPGEEETARLVERLGLD